MRRPSPFAPLSVTFATGKTGTAIQNKHGLEGLGTWAAMIAAAKRGRGQIVFAHEADWQAIGILRPPSFTLREFLKTTGNMKQTRTETHGHVMYVQLTHYEDWNNDAQRQDARERKSRYDAEKKRTKNERLPNWKRTKKSAELELEAEEELEKGSNEATLLPPAGDKHEPEGLPLAHTLLYTRLLAHVGNHGDANTPAVIRSYANRASEGQLAKVLESAEHAHARNRAKYVVGALKAEVGTAAA